jgi:uncharacterized RDD family membrane protein YckC
LAGLIAGANHTVSQKSSKMGIPPTQQGHKANVKATQPGTTRQDQPRDIAGPGARSFAFVVDWHYRVLLAMGWFVFASLLFSGSLVPPERASANYNTYLLLVLMPALALYLLYHPLLEILMRGSTPGKRTAGIRIVRRDGSDAGIKAHLVRNLLRLLDCLPLGYCVGLAATLLTRDSVRLGDLAAGTVLMYLPAKNTALVETPGDQRRTRLGQELLARWDELSPSRRSELAVRLLQGLDPELVLGTSEPDLRRQLETCLRMPSKEKTPG